MDSLVSNVPAQKESKDREGEVRVCERVRQADRGEETERGRGFISLTLIRSVQEY